MYLSFTEKAISLNTSYISVMVMRVIKTVKDFGSTSITTSSQTLETQTIKQIGDLLSWGIATDLTTVAGTGTYDVNAGTPTGAWLGSNVNKLFKRVSVKDNQNRDLLQAQGTDLHHMAYLLSIVDPNEFLFDRGLVETPTIDTGSVTSQTDNVIFAQSVLFKDLPASIEIEIGVLDDYYLAVGTGTATLNSITIWARYTPPQASGVTLRVNAFNVQAFSADFELAHLLPEAINIIKLAFTPTTPNGGAVTTDMNVTRVTRLSFRRGSSEEIEEQKVSILNDWQNQVNTGDRPVGLTVIPTDAFIKSTSTTFKFYVSAQVSPRIYYVYQLIGASQ